MMFLFRKYKKLMIFLIYVHNFKTIYIKKWEENYGRSQELNNCIHLGALKPV